LPGFPTTTSGTYQHTFDLLDPTIYNTTFRNNAGAPGPEMVLVVGLAVGTAYTDIHTLSFPGGEIRGQLVAGGLPGPPSVGGFTLCPDAAVDRSGNNGTFTNLPGPNTPCSAGSAVRLDIPASTDYARLAWHSGDTGYPSPLTIGNLGGLSGDV